MKPGIAGLSRDAFFNHLIADLSMISGLPGDLRRFAQDEADESLLLRHAKRACGRANAPEDNEAAFVAECSRAGEQDRSQRTP